MTGSGVILGTPAYMAPEQAKGTTRRSACDVWAFGVVLYEMVTGERPFRGESLQETLAAVLTADPEWARVPPAVRPLLRACLERDPLKRLRDIADYRFLLAPSEAAPARNRRSSLAVIVDRRRGTYGRDPRVLRREIAHRDEGTSAPAAPIRLSTMLPAGVSVTRGPGYTSSVAVSPDGRTMVIAASDKDGQRLYRRSLDRLDPTPLAGTERGSSPFFSWDGQWIGFFADGRLKRIPAAGGASVDVAAAPGFSSGASWGPDDRIVFAYGADSHLHVVPAEGGRVEPLMNEAARAAAGGAAGWTDGALRSCGTYSRLRSAERRNHKAAARHGAALRERARDLQPGNDAARGALQHRGFVDGSGNSGRRRRCGGIAGQRRRSPLRDLAQRLARLRAGRRRVRIGRRRRRTPSSALSGNRSARWKIRGSRPMVATWSSPPGAATMKRRTSGCTTCTPGTATRLTSDGGRAAVWSNDGITITYSHLGEQQGIYTTRVDGGGDATQLLALNAFHWLVGWTPDRSTLLYGVMLEGEGHQSWPTARRSRELSSALAARGVAGCRATASGWRTTSSMQARSKCM